MQKNTGKKVKSAPLAGPRQSNHYLLQVRQAAAYT